MLKLIAKSVMLVVLSALMLLSVTFSYAATGSDFTTTRQISDGIPFKKTNLMVLGDSLGDGIWTGLYRAFRKQKNIKVIRKSKPSTGFVRLDYYDWNVELAQILSQTRIDIAVVMIGANDRQTISTKDGRYRPGSKRWREIYSARVDSFIKQLKSHGAKVYWVGLPITRRKKFARHMKILNDIFAERAAANNIIFVDIWKDFITAKGRYSANGKDIKGRMRKLRANDGVHFTMRGYRKLALAAERFIRADLLTDSRPAGMVKIAKKQTKPEQKQIESVVKSPGGIQVFKPGVKKNAGKTRIATVMPELLMMKPEVVDEGVKQRQPLSGIGAALEKSKPRVEFPETVIIGKKVPNMPIVIKVLPKFQPDADYLAKNLQKSEETDAGRAIRQALANDFQDILSIVQPDKAVVVASRAVVAPDQEVHSIKVMALPQRQQRIRSVTISLRSDLPVQSDTANPAPGDVGSVRPVSMESDTPDDNVEYARKVEYGGETPSGQGAFTGTSKLASITPVSGLDSATGADAERNRSTIGYRTLLRGDALSPKAGRGDDFSWPRD